MAAFETDDVNRSVRRAERAVKSMLTALRNASKDERIRTARSIQNTYFRSKDAKLVAASRAWHRMARKHRPAAILGIAERIDCRVASTEPTAYRQQLKSSGHTRTIFDFGPEQTARQLITDAVLRSVFTPPKWQYEHRGRGGDRAIGEILRLARLGYHYAACLDIKNCFESFVDGKVEEILPLPREVTRHVILASGLVFAGNRRFAYRMSNARYISRSEQPTGLPQGSVVSNLVASILLSDLGQVITPGCHLIGFRDDFVVLGRTESEVDESATALQQALLNHRSGSLGLGRYERTTIEGGFEFLGYRLMTLGGKPAATLSQFNKERYCSAFYSALLDDLQADRQHPIEVETVLRRRSCSFPHWTHGPAETERLIMVAKEVINRTSANSTK